MFFLLIYIVGFAVAASAGVYQNIALLFLGGAILATGHFAAVFPKIQAKKEAKKGGWVFYPNKISLYFVMATLFCATPFAVVTYGAVHG